jgi:quinol monooxygenase YgiN
MKLGDMRNRMAQNEIRFGLELTIEGSKIAECKKLVQYMVKVVEANEPDTINYKYYLNNTETSCVINEAYKNSDAALAHLKGVAP